MERELIYLDNAATGFPKPRAVTDAVSAHMRHSGGNPGRGAHPLAMAAAECVFDCRMALAELFCTEPEQIIFTMNTTYALNLCIKGLLHNGDHVLLSDMEHNAVLRPVHKLSENGAVTYDIFPSLVLEKNFSPLRICAAIAKRLTPSTKMVICAGSFNICSAVMPLAAIGRFCRRHGLLFVVDGAQCAGHMAINMEEMCIDALAIPAHKGLQGPQGAGALLLGKGIRLDTLIEGGNGIASLEPSMPEYSPERYESGTLPVPALAGFCEGIRTIKQLGLDVISEHERRLFCRCREELLRIPSVTVYTPHHEGAVLLFNIDGIPSEKTASILAQRGICVRGGYHCNALGHKALGTPEGGAVRASFGLFNCSQDIDALCQAVRAVSV